MNDVSKVLNDFKRLPPSIRSHYIMNTLLDAAKSGAHIYENELIRISNLPAVRPHSNKIQKLCREYYDYFHMCNDFQLRPAIKENVEAAIKCRDLSRGFLVYECPNCNNMHAIGIPCKSRFCTSCGNKYKEQRAESISKTVLDKPHRHFVFSIVPTLRRHFAVNEDRDALLDLLFEAASDAVNSIFYHFDYKKQKYVKNKNARTKEYELGFISFLHTYGRSINWHPHIHILICEGYIDNSNKFHRRYFFPYEKLRRCFLKRLLNKMEAYFKTHKTHADYNAFKDESNEIQRLYPNGYYFYGKNKNYKKNDQNNKVSVKNIARYIARYAAHAAIAESRLEVDYEKHEVTYFFDPHQDDEVEEDDPKYMGRQYVTMQVFPFMKRLFRHIPNKGFHNIRYNGFYSNRTKKDMSKFKHLYTSKEVDKIKEDNKWNNFIKRTYGYEPLLCSCGAKMVFNLERSFFLDKNDPEYRYKYSYEEDDG